MPVVGRRLHVLQPHVRQRQYALVPGHRPVHAGGHSRRYRPIVYHLMDRHPPAHLCSRWFTHAKLWIHRPSAIFELTHSGEGSRSTQSLRIQSRYALVYVHNDRNPRVLHECFVTYF
jgi:hypothetical protein